MTDIHQVELAYQRVKPYIHKTPIVQSSLLNQWLGHNILFKAESLQRVGAFKIRGAINAIAKLHEQNQLPEKIVANSSGNHAQAVALAAKLFGIPAHIFMTEKVSRVKAAATQAYGAQISFFATRELADQAVAEAAQQPNTLWLPPFNHPDIIAGQGTLLYESLQQIEQTDAVVAPCGGGGMLSGTCIVAHAQTPKITAIGAEPKNANDAARSLQTGQIQKLTGAPDTMADGAATPSIGNHTFPFLKQLDAFYEIEESRIAYWTQWLQHLLKLHVEPTSAMAMQAGVEWLRDQTKPKTLLVMLTGGNIDQNMMQRVWQQDHLTCLPSLQ